MDDFIVLSINRLTKMKKVTLVKVLFLIVLFALSCQLYGQGSRILAPNYQGTAALDAPAATPSADNDDFAWLEHDSGLSGNFLDPGAPANERMFVYLRAGETLRYGIRRIPVRYAAATAYSAAAVEGNNQDLTIVVYDNGGTIQQATYYDTDDTSAGDATLLTSNGSGTEGIIGSVAESLLGPEFTFNSITYNTGGYTPIEYTNNTGSDQAFYIAFLQDDHTYSDEATLIAAINGATLADINVRSWYDLWDFTVYDGPEEKTGRLYTQRWGFTAQYFENRLADEFQLYIRVPSTIGGANAGNYIKQLDIGGIDPFSLVLYANSEGSDGTGGDTNGDGVTDFQDFRQGQATDIGFEEYDIFLQNPDIDIWPTTSLPTVTITDAVIYCNDAGTGGEAAITFETDQVGYIAILVDINGVGGYQVGTTDVIIETEVTTAGSQSIRWDGLDGLGGTVSSGTSITLSGRFTSGPIHVPMFDVEESAVGINMLDVRPSTSFDLIYWDDTYLNGLGQATGASPTAELDGTNTDTHLWDDNGGNNGGDDNLINTWSFGYYQVNTQNINFNYSCDEDGDGVDVVSDQDSDNDGLTNAQEGDINADADADNIPNYLDADFAGYTDSNGDGVDDNFDADLDGIPDALDVDSDNDGIPDLVELGGVDADNNGQVDGFTDVSGGSTTIYTISTGCSTTFLDQTGHSTGPTTDDGEVTTTLPFDFDFYGTTQSSGATVTISPNGWFAFGDLTAVGNPWNAVSVPSGTYTNTIFLNHRDWDPSSGGTVTFGTNGTGANEIFIVTYTNVPFFGAGGTGTVQLQLYETTNEIRIVTTNFSPDDGDNVTMGLNEDGTTGDPVAGRNLQNYTITTAECVSFVPSQPNGVDDTIDSTPLTLTDTDSDGISNYLDIDSDNDGIVDVVEAGGTADAATGRIASFTDSNDNGLNDFQESSALALTDTDADGSLPNYLDIDSENDGILDNVEGQNSASYIASAAGDTDSDGLLDVYDPDNGGTFIDPVDTDTDGTDDYLSADADGDGVDDFIEGWDDDRDGFSDLDATGSNNDLSDETGYNVDADSDGLWDIYESGGPAPTQNTDGAGGSDFQDSDDDNDGTLTSGEDVNGNSDWTDDKTQGQGGGAATPDYLYRGDYDGDAIADANDADSDNDGILDADEDNGETIDPSGDEDGDGIANYLDQSDATVTSGLSATTDSNSDNVYDVFDSDLDGVPDFLDLDSDNDGIWDAVEADGGSVPNGLNTTTGQFNLQDPDNDGLMNYVDTDDASSGGTSDLANPDSDGDGLNDYRDIDSDDDGITDIIEAQTRDGFIALSNTDTDGDGIDDSFDPDNGGTLIDPVNSEGLGLQDYLDTDSDDDGIRDIIEGDDSDEDGYGDWDVSTQDNDETNETGWETLSVPDDADGDGLRDLFDNVTKGTVGNATGSNSALQNSDGIDFRNWRDADDDNDGNITQDEDTNGNSNWADDLNDDPTANVPDFLYFADFDADGIADVNDGDSDNDGILDSDEDGGEGVDPSADADNDGIPNYKDANDPGLSSTADINGDGVYDVYDADLDGIPDFRDRDSDNDGISDLVEVGLTDADGDGSLDDGAGITDLNSNGIPDAVDASCTGAPVPATGDAESQTNTNVTSGDNALGGVDGNFATIPNQNDFIDLFLGRTVSSGTQITISVQNLNTGNTSANFEESADGTTYTNTTASGNISTTQADFFYTLAADADYIRITNSSAQNRDIALYHISYSYNIPACGPGTTVTLIDSDGDGLENIFDIDADGDGIPDLVEAGGTDADGDGKVDDLTDTDSDGFADTNDTDNGGTALTLPDTDVDGVANFLDVDSDNDGVPDAVENGGIDTNNDGIIDSFAADADGDGYPDAHDPDSGGTPIANVDSDGDGIDDYLDLDVDNDGYPDILEAGGTDDGDGIVNAILNSDPLEDTVPDAVDVDITAGTDSDVDEIDDAFDVDFTGGSDTDGDGIDDAFDPDADGNGFDDAAEATPYGQEDKEGDGLKDFRDLDSDGDGIPDAEEFGETIDSGTGQISGFTDSNSNGWNDTQESTPITPPNTDGDGFENYRDIDSDDDGIPDNIEGQTKNTYVAISGTDTDSDGLDDAYDPNNGGTLPTTPNTDGTGSDDYLDTDADDDTVPDVIEGDNDDRSQYADWDTDSDNDITDETGYNIDTDSDGLEDVFDTNAGNSSANVTGSNSDGMDTDFDGNWDFQDNDDDGDGTLTSAEDTDTVDGDPTNDFADGGNPIPDYLLGNTDDDGDSVTDDSDLDSDNDGISDVAEAGGIPIDPSGDFDSDGIQNAFDSDMDGDAITNTADTDVDGNSVTDTFSLTDSNSDGVPDEFDKDLDGVPDFRDLDSDNDGIADIVEIGLSDTDEDGTLDNGGGITDANSNGIDDSAETSNVAAETDETLTATGPVHNLSFTVSTDEVISAVTLAFDLQGDYGPQAGEDYTVTFENGADLGTYDNLAGADCDIINNSISITAADWNEANDDGTVTITVTGGGGVNSITCTGAVSSSITNISVTYITSALTIPDSDSDGIDDHQDLDSDNDGITDNVEAQAAGSYVAPVIGDSDGDGILNVYDEDVSAGNAIDPTNTDGADNDDYLDDDSDNDGIADVIEAFDTNNDGFGSWDSDSDNDPTDETNYSFDSDSDGILLLFDSNSGLGSIANITGSSAERQDTDSDGTEDWRDTDDDEDGTLTSAEDGNTNLDWTDDFGQGGGSIPDYLFLPDNDGDGVVDESDNDGDNDGIPNLDEYAGTTYAVGSDVSSLAGTPFGDSDGDGIYNYLDASDVNFSITDVNGDNIDDRVDQDRDGVPNFFDLDSDNDGMPDGLEANNGVVASGFSNTTGVFTYAGDTDVDGYIGSLDSDDGGTALANPDFDSDGLSDYEDLDSDNDGISDNTEGPSTASYVAPSGTDTDSDGWDNSYDADNGGAAITVTNTDGTGEPDYRDDDSDDDGVEDFIEGYDANQNGFSELDSDLDGDLSDETGYNADADSDGLWDLYDSFSGRGNSNINGNSADLQDTDGDTTLDFRDTDDDSDAQSTNSEDNNLNGDWTDDKTQGGGATPDYLFFNDFDGDGVSDGTDEDGDNDGLSNAEEYDGANPDPFGDIDGDGVFNYFDSNDPALTGTLTDSDADGVWDEYDLDHDGIPNFFDLDSDNDGIPDAVEANGGTLPGAANDQGQFPPATTDTDGDGWIDLYDGDNGGTSYTLPDTDGDGVNDIYDFDSDNDGITDVVEAGGADFDGDGMLDSFGDTDGDGLGNAVDSDNGGTAFGLSDSDTDFTPNYLQVNSDGDAFPDWDEGFDDDEDDDYVDDYASRRTTWVTANPGIAAQYPTTDANTNSVPDYLDDTDSDGRPNFLDPDNGTYYFDTDSDGIVDFFDPDLSGTSYANVSGEPDNDGDMTPNFEDGDDTPLPLDWVSFEATYDKGNVNLAWQTVNEENVSHFEIEHGLDGENFEVIGTLQANNTTNLNSYQWSHRNPVVGVNYYRLNQIDFDGQSAYSWIRTVSATDEQIKFTVYPNPSEDVITISADAIFSGQVQLIDIDGKVLWSGRFETSNNQSIDLTNYATGVYMLRIETPDGMVRKRVVKK